ncbi:MAG: ATP-binding protein [Dokdonella sp.]
MSGFFSYVRQQLSDRPDTEHEQAIIRLLVLGAATLYATGVTIFSHWEGSQNPSLPFFVEFIVGLGLLGSIVVNPAVSHVRRGLGMLIDYSMLTISMVMVGEPMASLIVVMLWVTVGNGLRYGVKFLRAAVMLGVFAFGIVLAATEYWHKNLMLGIGLLVGLVAIPMYLNSLLRALTTARDDARRANAAKSRFIANMSHEFRTPLNGLVGMSQVLATTPLNSEQRECAQVIDASVHTLLSLVDDVLDISAIEAGKLQRSDVDFRVLDLLHSIELILQPLANEKGLELRVRVKDGVPAALTGDRDHLRQIVLNLATNAVKFTEKGTVRIDVGPVEGQTEDTPMLRFSVRDTGIGIPHADQSRIFRAFEQVENGLARRFGGTGLGTTIAKALAELMGGKIDFRSNPGMGSHFWVDVPFVAAKAAVEPEMAASGDNVVAFDGPFVRHRKRAKPLNLLIADDQPTNLMVLRRILGKAGHQVRSAANGDEVLAALEQDAFDAVILDLHMPGMSGIEVIQQARFMEAGRRSTPIVVLSADATSETARECERAGAFAYLTKPISVNRLLDVLAELSQQKVVERAVACESAERDDEISVIERSVLDQLASLKLGDGFVGMFVQECLRDANNALTEVERAAQLGLWAEYRDHCHALKGVAANMGATRLAATAEAAMRAIPTSPGSDWKSQVRLLRSEYELAREALNVPLSMPAA